MLHLVVLGRRGAVRVDVIDVFGADAGVGQRVAHAGDDRLAVRARPGAVEGIGFLAAAFEDAEHARAARSGVIEIFRAPGRRAPSASTKPSRFFENGFEACSGGSFWVESADRSEKRTSDSGVSEPSAPIASAA